MSFSFKWHVTSYKWFRKLFSSGSHLNMFHLNCKGSSIIVLANADSWFITEYHFHLTAHRPLLFLFNLIFSCLCESKKSNKNQHKFHFTQPIYSFVTKIDSVSTYLVFSTFSIFKIYCFKFSNLMLSRLLWSFFFLSCLR